MPNTNKQTIIQSNTKSKIEAEMDLLADDILEVRKLDKNNATFTATSGGFVSLTYNGTTYARVNFYRTFPFTNPREYISVRETDEKAREIGIILSLSDLSKEQQTLIEQQLTIRYFTPTILKLIQLKQEYGYAYLDADTNYGRCKFITRISNSSIVALSPTRVLLIDIDGNRFEIPDLSKLSKKEQRKIELIL